MNGILVIDKPSGLTSHDVVNRLRRILQERSVGHLGTLDPSATGVLPMVFVLDLRPTPMTLKAKPQGRRKS